MVQIQIQMAERAVELLTLPEDQSSYVLDVGYDHFDYCVDELLRVIACGVCLCLQNLIGILVVLTSNALVVFISCVHNYV